MKSAWIRVIGLCAVLATLPAGLFAMETVERCAGEEYRAFDFWLGEWTVINRENNNLAGHNRITRILAGCALEESWQSAQSAYTGRSFNFYDAASGVWHQTWVDNSGQVLLLEGGPQDGKMVLEQQKTGAHGAGTILHRITWSPLESDQVRQHWQISEDDGQSWHTRFDGLYTLKSRSLEEPPGSPD